MVWRENQISWKSVKQFNNWNDRHKSDTYKMVTSYGYTFSSLGIECTLIKLAWRHLTADSCYVSATVLYWNLNMLLRGKKNRKCCKTVLRFTGCLFLLPLAKENFRVIFPISQRQECVDPYQYIIIKLLVKSGQYRTRKSNEILDKHFSPHSIFSKSLVY